MFMELHTRPLAPEPYAELPKVPAFTVTSPDFADGDPLAPRHAADHEDLSPALAWTGFPPETRSFVVNCFDPDAPTPAGFWHWTALDIPASCTELPRGAGAPDGAALPAPAFHVRHDGGGQGYMGCAPPPGDRAHRYIFAVHALDIPSLADAAGLGPDTSPTAVAFNALFHTLARGVITGTYQR